MREVRPASKKSCYDRLHSAIDLMNLCLESDVLLPRSGMYQMIGLLEEVVSRIRGLRGYEYLEEEFAEERSKLAAEMNKRITANQNALAEVAGRHADQNARIDVMLTEAGVGRDGPVLDIENRIAQALAIVKAHKKEVSE